MSITQVGDNIEETFREHAELTRKVELLEEQVQKLEAFKKYVHGRLDAANVPHNPEPESNAKHGCRIEGRLNFLEKQLAKAKQDGSDWMRHWGQLDRERSSLKGRITRLRGGLKGLAVAGHFTDVAEAELRNDDARRRRFEKKERRR